MLRLGEVTSVQLWPIVAIGNLDPDLAIFQVTLEIWVFMCNLFFVKFRRLNFKIFSKNYQWGATFQSLL